MGQDTFSIIAADPETGEIGAAGATCVDNIASLGGIKILNKIIPGKGGINAQASICINPHINLETGITQMANGLSPEEILDHLYNNDNCFASNGDPESRQYGVLDFDDNGDVRTAAFSGINCLDYKGHITGPHYSIQGNILLGPEVIEEMEKGFNNTEGSLANKLMAAMQGANIPGADSRCLDRGTSSTTAFLKVVKPDDLATNPSLLLDILEMPFGEEPIDSLQVLFDEWSQLVSADKLLDTHNSFQIYPNPIKDELNIRAVSDATIHSYHIYDLRSQLIINKSQINTSQLDLDFGPLDLGIYLLHLEDKKGRRHIQKVIKI